MKDWITIFNTGKHTDRKGRTRFFSTGDLNRIVESYNPGYQEAPVVIGTVKNTDPAFGWVEKLIRDGNELRAKFKQIHPEFQQNLENGRYKRRFISLYPDGTLRHVAFDGPAPAISGFSSYEEEWGETFEFEEAFFEDQNGGWASLTHKL